MRVFVRWAVPLLVAAASGCSREEPVPSPSRKEVPVVAPIGLVAELEVPEPRRVWASLRKLGGERAALLPSSFELGLFALLDLPPRVAGYLRPDTPIVGVALLPPGAAATAVVGVRTMRGAELVKELASGTDAPFRAERDGSPVTLLVGSAGSSVLGIVDDWLLIGREANALRASGVYLARGLGARRPRAEPITVRIEGPALAGPISAGLRERWATLRADLADKDRAARALHGRAPDFADPAALLGLADGVVASTLQLSASIEHATLTLEPDADHVELRLSIAPRKDGALARFTQALAVGPLAPLLELPSDVLFAVLSRSSDAERAAAAETPADAVRSVLGPRLPEKDAAPLAEALRSFHRGRGDVTAFGLLADGSAFLRQTVREPKELDRGLRGLVRLLSVPALAEPLEPVLGKMTAPPSATRVAGLEGLVQRAELTRQGAEKTEVLTYVRGASASTVVAPRAGDVLVALERPTRTLAAASALRTLVQDRVPSSLVLYANMPSAASAAAPALALLGKDAQNATIELVLSAPACAALLERFGTP
ncbi:MAG TPA: hypothetical protein VFZ53_17070 [Polyangiaceae bacterium]